VTGLYEIFQLPLTIEAFQQYSLLSAEITNMKLNRNPDEWRYIWGSCQYSVHKAYRALSGHMPTHPVFNNLWASKCQLKHKIFCWLLLHDKLNTRERLRIRHMALETYTCENCTLQGPKTTYHLFLRCNFAKMCWSSVGVSTPRISCPQRAVRRLSAQLPRYCAMEIIILMSRGIWKCRNCWIFDPPNASAMQKNAVYRTEPFAVQIKAQHERFIVNG
jgi:hypothetical protein